jgi:choline kinase
MKPWYMPFLCSLIWYCMSRNVPFACRSEFALLFSLAFLSSLKKDFESEIKFRKSHICMLFPCSLVGMAHTPEADAKYITAVIIAEPQCISPQPSPRSGPVDGVQSSRGSLPSKQYRTNTLRRLSGRAPPDVASPSLRSISSLSSVGSSSTLEPAENENKGSVSKPHHHVGHHDRASHIISQVAKWLHTEKARKAAHRSGKRGHHDLGHAAEATKNLVKQVRSDESTHHGGRHERANANLSDGSFALEKLEQILSKGMAIDEDGNRTPKDDRKDSYFPRQKSRRQGSKRLLRKTSTLVSSDTEYQEPDIDVPSAEVVLDNSKTLGYSGGMASSEVSLTNPKKRAAKEQEAWLQFKHEIVRLTHTLRLKGWKRMPLDRSVDIDVERLSGALTNAVYVVSPPSNLPQTPAVAQDSTISIVPRNPPA